MNLQSANDILCRDFICDCSMGVPPNWMPMSVTETLSVGGNPELASRTELLLLTGNIARDVDWVLFPPSALGKLIPIARYNRVAALLLVGFLNENNTIQYLSVRYSRLHVSLFLAITKNMQVPFASFEVNEIGQRIETRFPSEASPKFFEIFPRIRSWTREDQLGRGNQVTSVNVVTRFLEKSRNLRGVTKSNERLRITVIKHAGNIKRGTPVKR